MLHHVCDVAMTKTCEPITTRKCRSTNFLINCMLMRITNEGTNYLVKNSQNLCKDKDLASNRKTDIGEYFWGT